MSTPIEQVLPQPPQHTREQVVDALDQARSVAGAAKALGVSRTTLYAYLRRYDISVSRAIVAR